MNGSTTPDADQGRARLVAELAEADGPAETVAAFPERLWSLLVGLEAPRWSIPRESGGVGLDKMELLERYSEIAKSSLTAAFILSQHDAAVRRLLAGSDSGASKTWLPRIADGSAFTTIGVSQLTTSRRMGAQALRAEPIEHGRHRLRGSMPWVTAAERADVFVTGAVREEGLQILAALPADRAGVSVKPAFPLAALEASRTAEVVCDGVILEPSDLLAPPSPDVMAHIGAAGTGGLETSALAIGQAEAALAALETTESLGDLAEPADALRSAIDEARAALRSAALGRPDAPASATVRASANGLALRCTQAYLTARRGRGFLKDDPAQRWARQALFFLVWSCPAPVAQAAIREMAGLCPP